LFIHVANRLRKRAERHIRDIYDEIGPRSDRPPVLFLRSFRDDAIDLDYDDGGPGGQWMTIGNAQSSLDRMLVTEFGDWSGPVIALGNPDDAMPPFGAVRRYASHDS